MFRVRVMRRCGLGTGRDRLQELQQDRQGQAGNGRDRQGMEEEARLLELQLME